MIRKAKAVWRGSGRAGGGNLFTDSGVLAETPYSFKTRFENEKGTNPEELIAAAHAGCFRSEDPAVLADELCAVLLGLLDLLCADLLESIALEVMSGVWGIEDLDQELPALAPWFQFDRHEVDRLKEIPLKRAIERERQPTATLAGGGVDYDHGRERDSLRQSLTTACVEPARRSRRPSEPGTR